MQIAHALSYLYSDFCKKNEHNFIMKSKIISPFKPALIKDYYPHDLKIYTFNAGFKKKKKDPWGKLSLRLIWRQLANIFIFLSLKTE